MTMHKKKSVSKETQRYEPTGIKIVNKNNNVIGVWKFQSLQSVYLRIHLPFIPYIPAHSSKFLKLSGLYLHTPKVPNLIN